MRIAMIGQKGIPATWGGVERHVEELAARLVERGHEVTVFTRPNYADSTVGEYRGISLVSVPTLGTKHLDAIVHSVLCSLLCWGGRYDIVHYHSIGPCLASPVAKARGRKVVATIHGRDWQRGKWGRAASAILRLGEWMALHVPDATICVSEALRAEYAAESSRQTVFIPNGITITQADDSGAVADLGLSMGEFILFFGRLVPEKGVHHLLAAYNGSGLSMPLVITGDASMSDEYVSSLRASAGDGVVFSGYEFGSRLAGLIRRAALVVLPSDLEGLPLVLLEAIAYGAPVLVSDIAPHREILGLDGAYFRAGDTHSLRAALLRATEDLESVRAGVERVRERVLATYRWDSVADKTAALYEDLVGSSKNAEKSRRS